MRRKLRVAKGFKATDLPRVSVFRSAKHIYGQVIDDANQKTLASSSTIKIKELKGDKKVIAYQVGQEFAKNALEKGVKKLEVDDRSC